VGESQQQQQQPMAVLQIALVPDGRINVQGEGHPMHVKLMAAEVFHRVFNKEPKPAAPAIEVAPANFLGAR